MNDPAPSGGLDGKDMQERHLAELEIFRQCLQEKNERLSALQKQIENLQMLLGRFAALPRSAEEPKPPAVRPFGPPPRRWAAR